jgi:putative DNA primase/helicase
MRAPLRDRAQGRWPAILSSVGIADHYLTGRHTACPICRGGKDRFRFDNLEGRGTYICSKCGAGDGVKLVMEVNGWTFREAAERIEALVGDEPTSPPPQQRSEAEKRAALQRLWGRASPVRDGDPVARYLQRRLGQTTFPEALRTVLRLRYPDSGLHPGMLAVVTAPDGTLVNVHRTYLTPQGSKAPVARPRMFMPGKVPPGSAVRLFSHENRLGIAEGIETALSASKLFDVPCWAALTKDLLSRWTPPSQVQEVIIFADHDAPGQTAAYALASRLTGRGRRVKIEIPDQAGQDWNDVLIRDRTEGLDALVDAESQDALGTTAASGRDD